MGCVVLAHANHVTMATSKAMSVMFGHAVFFMKTLLLVRHAKTKPAGPNQADHARELQDSGVSDARRLGRYLSKKGLRPDKMLVSSATRTQSTAHILLREIDAKSIDVVVSDELYLADSTSLAHVVQGTRDGVDTLMIVGHNPGLSELAHEYDQTIGELSPAQMLWVEFDIEDWVKASPKRVLRARVA